ncbi:MAG: hypothetical protein LKJ29_10655 [Lactobacillus sp.]|jgi:hypothetical protein|uniref:Uncharacterized protein n=1 Tax=Lacticaseibacillus suilingensis TaxID=2799577 RepID=A0ABW4BIC7_9LACO|nr:hypothetical protein [Lacticaseibacillus suilingensis]MCI1895245.1 hypothetical protein [Lactobacillus sp.]MCI1942497.1 hypothetical protein [Lactobacillus sp.]MCI1973102.1 hypothetical protein [Lactobacillus sp.]MCI2017947.1 hypothetical protein [Lactobacillus sp.]
MSQDIEVEWNQAALNNIKTFSLDQVKHDSADEKRLQTVQAVTNLMRDKQVNKAMKLLAAE